MKDCFMDSYSPHITTALHSSVAEPEVIKSKLLEKMFFHTSYLLVYCNKLITLCCAVHFVWLLFGGGIYSGAAFIPFRMPWIRRHSRVSGVYELFLVLCGSHKR